jgi:hypothetical protein
MPGFDDTGGVGQYTFEGELAQLGNLASGARRARGVKGVAAKLLVGWLLLSALSVPVFLIIYIVHAVIDRHGL